MSDLPWGAGRKQVVFAQGLKPMKLGGRRALPSYLRCPAEPCPRLSPSPCPASLAWVWSLNPRALHLPSSPENS